MSSIRPRRDKNSIPPGTLRLLLRLGDSVGSARTFGGSLTVHKEVPA